MNIIEAIKSGKRFRRKGEKDWYYNDPECFMSGIQKELSSDDWEVEERKMTITETQLNEAIYYADLHTSKAPDEPGYMQEFIKQLKKELGL